WSSDVCSSDLHQFAHATVCFGGFAERATKGSMGSRNSERAHCCHRSPERIVDRASHLSQQRQFHFGSGGKRTVGIPEAGGARHDCERQVTRCPMRKLSSNHYWNAGWECHPHSSATRNHNE